jgi:hypothetical protein
MVVLILISIEHSNVLLQLNVKKKINVANLSTPMK